MDLRTGRIAIALGLALVLVLVLGGCGGVSIRQVRRNPDESGPALDPAADLRTVARAAEILAVLPPGPEPDPRRDAAREFSNEALARFLKQTSGRKIRLDEEWRAELAARGIRLTIRRDAAVLAPDQFTEFLLARDYSTKGIEHEYHAPGLGVPLIAIRRFTLKELTQREGIEKFLLPRQIQPATAILRVLPPPANHPYVGPEYRLELHDSLRFRAFEESGRREPLATDLTTPLVYHFARSPLPILQEIGLLQPQWLEELKGLYLLHPYQPGKIPVVLVHGLRSSPLAWLKVINDLRGDPALRARYQFWIFMYPTGTPFPLPAADLRAKLNELRAVIDPKHADGALDRMVLVGHSMGGLVSKMMIVGSGDALWRLVSTHPFEEIKATEERKESLRRVFFFEPHPSVRRVVFIATPHRGSELGDEFIGRLTDRLIRLPSRLLSTYRALIADNGADFFTPEFRSGLPSSIDELRRDNSLLETLSRLPISPMVPYHSIIGLKKEGVPPDQNGDGVVAYASAHLDGAASECLVRGDHGCQDSSETIAELRRILGVHLRAMDREAGTAGIATRKPDPIKVP